MLSNYIFSTLSLKPQPCNFGEVQRQTLLFWGHLSRPGDVSCPVPGAWFTSAWLRFQFELELKDGSQTVAICPVFIAVNHAGWLVICTCHGSLLQRLCVDFGRKGVRPFATKQLYTELHYKLYTPVSCTIAFKKCISWLKLRSGAKVLCARVFVVLWVFGFFFGGG